MRSSPARSGCSAARAIAWAGLGVALAGCVTTYEEAPLFGDRLETPEYAVAVTIPIESTGPGPEQALVAEFYGSVLQRLHDAAKERDLPELESLLASYERTDLPPALLSRVQGYRAIARGLRFCQHAAQKARLAVVPVAADAPGAPPMEGDAPALGAPLQLELTLPAGAEPVVLGGREDDDPIGFLVSVTVEDLFVEGSSRSARTQDFVWQPTALTLGGDTVLRLPVAIDLPGGTAVRRDITARVDLMPGYLQAKEGRLPVPQTTIAAATVTQWPVGHAAVAAAPLAELRTALRTFEPRFFARAFLAAAATRGADRETAIDLLLEQVRFGRADQAQVAMAALRTVTGADFLVGDRDAWLAWSRNRR